MSQEDKELLLKDLCSRLPYGVIVRHADYLIDSDGNYTGQFWYKRGYLYNICRLDNMTTTIIENEDSDEEGYEHICDLERSLPYLRPISSMTEEEEKELHKISNCHLEKIKCYNKKTNCCDLLKVKITNNYTPFGTFEVESEYSLVEQDNILAIIDYLNSHHFDYRGLIEKYLAIEAPEGMYK